MKKKKAKTKKHGFEADNVRDLAGQVQESLFGMLWLLIFQERVGIVIIQKKEILCGNNILPEW